VFTWNCFLWTERNEQGWSTAVWLSRQRLWRTFILWRHMAGRRWWKPSLRTSDSKALIHSTCIHSHIYRIRLLLRLVHCGKSWCSASTVCIQAFTVENLSSTPQLRCFQRDDSSGLSWLKLFSRNSLRTEWIIFLCFRADGAYCWHFITEQEQLADPIIALKCFDSTQHHGINTSLNLREMSKHG